MKLQSLVLYRYSLPFTEPFTFAGVARASREGFVLKLVTDVGAMAYGDIAPLPGFSQESPQQVQREAIVICNTPSYNSLEASSDLGSAANWFATQELSASVRFGVESALMTLVSLKTDSSPDPALPPLFRELAVSPRLSVPICALLAGSPEVVLDRAATLHARGYRAAKLKVGRRPVSEEIDLVRSVRDALGSEVGLRLDANRAWSDCDANSFAKGIESCRIEFIEEPLADPAGLPKLANNTGIPIALDESLVGADPASFEIPPGVVALVLKPTLLGGMSATLAWLKRARTSGILPVLSAAFESGIGMNALIQLAARTELGETPAGLDTYSWLAEDILCERLELLNGAMDVETCGVRAASPMPDRLQELCRG